MVRALFAVTLSVVLSGCGLGLAICPSECCDLYALWDADDISGSLVRDPLDRTSAKIVGAGVTSGLNGQAFSFVDDADRVEIQGAPLSDVFSISAWVNPSEARFAQYRSVASQWNWDAEMTKFAAYDAGNTLPGAKGYWGSVFDGRYVYYSPADNGIGFHGNVLRYDTHQAFDSASAWQGYNAAGTSGLNTVGYTGAVFDGRYVYFIPYLLTPGTYHANVLRYDSHGDFSSPASWVAYDASSTDGLSTKGYIGGVFDGRYLYFSPSHDGVAYHGRILRFDTRADFTSPSSWQAYDAGTTMGLVTRGFSGGVFDGRYIYFVPIYNGVVYHGFVLRFDTLGEFKTVSSWAAYDAGATNGLSTKGYRGAAFDGRYVFFAPSQDGVTYHGRVLRLDTRADFLTSSSWFAYDAGATSGLNTMGYAAAQFDGRYVYFAPHFDGSGHHGRVLRYDALSGFDQPASWQAVDADGTSGLNSVCYVGAAFDGRFVYFTPSNSPSGRHGRALRYDTAGAGSLFQLNFDFGGSQGGYGGTPSGPRFLVNTESGAVSVSASDDLSQDWHHLVGVFDGSAIALYVDGVLASQRAVSHSLTSDSGVLSLGGESDALIGLKGALEEVMLFRRGLSPDAVARIYADSASGVCR